MSCRTPGKAISVRPAFDRNRANDGAAHERIEAAEFDHHFGEDRFGRDIAHGGRRAGLVRRFNDVGRDTIGSGRQHGDDPGRRFESISGYCDRLGHQPGPDQQSSLPNDECVLVRAFIAHAQTGWRRAAALAAAGAQFIDRKGRGE
jgi:hypothetical protein